MSVCTPAARQSHPLHSSFPPHRAFESRVESLAAKALGSRARLVRVFRRTLPRSPPGGGGKPMKEGALLPEQDHILLGVRVRGWGWGGGWEQSGVGLQPRQPGERAPVAEGCTAA